MPCAITAANVQARWEWLARFIDDFAFDQHFTSFAPSLFNDGQRIRRRLLRIDIPGQITKRDHSELIRLQVAHELLESFGPRVNPRVFTIRHAMKLQDSNS